LIVDANEIFSSLHTDVNSISTIIKKIDVLSGERHRKTNLSEGTFYWGNIYYDHTKGFYSLETNPFLLFFPFCTATIKSVEEEKSIKKEVKETKEIKETKEFREFMDESKDILMDEEIQSPKNKYTCICGETFQSSQQKASHCKTCISYRNSVNLVTPPTKKKSKSKTKFEI